MNEQFVLGNHLQLEIVKYKFALFGVTLFSVTNVAVSL